jgi:hypothetical protein
MTGCASLMHRKSDKTVPELTILVGIEFEGDVFPLLQGRFIKRESYKVKHKNENTDQGHSQCPRSLFLSSEVLLNSSLPKKKPCSYSVMP